MIKICQGCAQQFNGRRHAQSCSAKCRMRLQRRARAVDNLARNFGSAALRAEKSLAASAHTLLASEGGFAAGDGAVPEMVVPPAMPPPAPASPADLAGSDPASGENVTKSVTGYTFKDGDGLGTVVPATTPDLPRSDLVNATVTPDHARSDLVYGVPAMEITSLRDKPRRQWLWLPLLLILALGTTGLVVKRHLDRQLAATRAQLDALNQDASLNNLTANTITGNQATFKILTVTDKATLPLDTTIGQLGVTNNTTIGGNLSVGGDGVFGGNLSAANFSGDGSNLENVDADTLQGEPKSFYTNASNLSTGTLKDARLSGNVALLNANNSFSGTNTFRAVTLQGHLTGTTGAFSGNVSGADAINVNEFVTLGQLTTVSAGNYFLQNGNSFGTTAALGTNDNFGLAFETNGTEKMRILTNGNVGIGTTNPARNLEVVSTGLTVIQAKTTGIGVADSAQLALEGSSAGGAYIWQGSANYSSYGGPSSLNILNWPNAPIAFFTNGPSERMRITGTGNVGIGTTAPGAKLDVQKIETTSPAGSYGALVSNALEGSGTIVEAFGLGAKLNLRNGTLSYGRGLDGALQLSGDLGAISPGQVSGINGGLLFRGSAFTAPAGEIAAVRASVNIEANQTYTAGTVALFDTATGFGGQTLTAQNIYGLRLRQLGSANYNATGEKLAILSDWGEARFLTGAAGNKGLVVQGAAAQTANLQEWQNSTGAVLARVDASGNGFFANGGGGTGAAFVQGGNSFGSTAILGTNDAFDLQLETGGATKLTVQNSTGNVGIGTTSPNQVLEVKGSTATNGTIRISTDAASTSAGSQTIQFGTNIGGVFTQTGIFGDTSGADSNVKLFATQGNLILGANTGGVATTRVLINSSGGVTIGDSDLASTTSQLFTNVSAAGVVGQIIRGATSQTANLTEWQDSAGSLLARINSGGAIVAGSIKIGTPIGGDPLPGILNGIVAPFNAEVFGIRGAAGQTANLITLQNSATNTIAGLTAGGGLFLGANGPLANTVAYINAGVGTNVNLAIRGSPSQTANLTEWQNDAGAVLAKVDANGVGTFAGATSSGHILPGADDTYDLGSPTLRWRDLYLGPTSLNISSTVAETGTARQYRLAIQEAVGASRGNLRIWDGTTDFVNITPTGNVGIGTTTPTALLNVSNGNGTATTIAHFNGSVNSPQVLVLSNSNAQNNINNDYLYLKKQLNGGVFSAAGQGVGMQFQMENSSKALQTSGAIRSILTTAAVDNVAALTFSTQNGTDFSERVRIDGTGNVGIGTTTGINSKLTFAADTTAAGGILFGTDTNLYRSGANVLKTDDYFYSAGDIEAWVGSTGGVRLTDGTFGGGLIQFGSARDTNLYRATANLLKTDDRLEVASGVDITTGAATTIGLVVKGAAAQTADLLQAQDSAGAVLASIAASGNINTTGVYQKGGVNGITATCLSTQTLNGISTAGGIVTAGTCTANATDLAEQYNSSQQLEPGDLVATDPASNTPDNPYVKRTTSPYQPNAIGIVSTKPYRVLGDDKPGYPIALAGRVPTKVSTENGPINIGDPITASSVPGVGMRAAANGRVVGVALEGFNPSTSSGSSTVGTIVVFVNPSWFNPSSSQAIQPGSSPAGSDPATGSDPANSGDGNFANLNVSGEAKLERLVVHGSTTLEGPLTVKGPAVFEGTLTVAGNAIFKGKLTVEGDLELANDRKKANAPIGIGATEYTYAFTRPHDNDSYILSLTPSWLTEYAMVEKTKDGFTIRFAKPAPADAKIDWFVIR